MSNEKDAYEAAQRLRALDQGESRSGFSGPALPSGSTVSSAPYQVPSLSSRSGPTSEGQPPKRRGATDNQITARLHNDDGSLRTHSGVASALQAAGLGASNARIDAPLQAAGGTRRLRGATDAQINARLHNDDGSLRTRSGVASALQAAGLGAGVTRIAAQLQAAGLGAGVARITAQLAAGGARLRPGATDAQIDAHLHNDDGSLRTRSGVASALRAAGLGASSARIDAQLQAAGGARLRPGATDAQIDAHLHNDDGSLRTHSGVASALQAAGLGASTMRIAAALRAAGGARLLRGATDAQINAHLHNDDGSLRTRSDVASALHAAGLGAGVVRIDAQLQAARGPQ
ncbi:MULTISPECIES: hypothetical protein [Pseudomonas]|uniref:Uncharacterized protein n=1 Tax=Pseudomonas wuhanensis TaxID=2954098 RepID=A0ABY9GLI9_9PSED|nr:MULTISPECIES: hypothetical protein [unclassified Pseudomonas]WLI10737.1 hypothetical protein PSH65_21305 [Pseudomonas sp. FP603]WLI16556.1 hypothetical protein PSH88_19930 [Pseudomonas sp. FP607]